MLSKSPGGQAAARRAKMQANPSGSGAQARQPARPQADTRDGRFRVPANMTGEKRVMVCCHYCGYGPSVVPAAGACPKCGGYSWDRFAIPVKLLPK